MLASFCFDLQTRSINLKKIKRIYKSICLKTHPDKTSDQEKIEESTDALEEIMAPEEEEDPAA